MKSQPRTLFEEAITDKFSYKTIHFLEKAVIQTRMKWEIMGQ